jgi:hypothetical protein
MGAASRHAYDAARIQSLPIPRKPGDDTPSLPHDPTSLGDQDLMMLYSEFTAWSDYLSVQVACASVDEKAAVSRLEVLESKFMFTQMRSQTKVTEARAEMKFDDQIVEAKKEVSELEAYRRMVEALYNSLERDAQLLSRELTRRSSSTRREGYHP